MKTKVYLKIVDSVNLSSIDDTVGESDSSPEVDVVLKRNLVGGSLNPDSYPTYQAGFINPFKPYHLSYKLTLFRHLWLHTFPTDTSGEAMQEHHKKVPMDQDGISPSVSCFQPYFCDSCCLLEWNTDLLCERVNWVPTMSAAAKWNK